MNLKNKGILSPFVIITSFLTGACFPLLGSILIIDLNISSTIYIEGLILTIIGGFLAHWSLAHTIHDLVHSKIEKRKTFSKKVLKILMIITLIILFSIALYLTYQRGWPILLFSIIGLICCVYADGYLHSELQMAFGTMFLVIGSFYVQAGRLDLDIKIWIAVIFIGLFSFFSQYGWILFYRLDDYEWNIKIKNRSILIAKTGLIFLILYFVFKIFI